MPSTLRERCAENVGYASECEGRKPEAIATNLLKGDIRGKRPGIIVTKSTVRRCIDPWCSVSAMARRLGEMYQVIPQFLAIARGGWYRTRILADERKRKRRISQRDRKLGIYVPG